MAGRTKWRVLGRTLTFVLKAIATALVVAVPVLGVWAGSSLAAYQNGPVWVAIAVGGIMFPVLPLAWDGWAQWRRSRKDAPGRRILTFWDRLVVRTFALNFAFLLAFLALWPQSIFTAISTRGDWMLEEWRGETGETVRAELLAFADGLSWLYEAGHDNPFGDEAGSSALPTPTPNQGLARQPNGEPDGPADADDLPDGRADRAVEADANDAPDPSDPQHEPEPQPDGPPTWPVSPTLHPLVPDMPVERETSITSVARYIAEREPDPFQRIKALHDYVADRIAYDGPAFVAGEYPPQDAETVFRTRTAVCAGYAKLMVALGEASGAEIVYVVGDARVRDSVTGSPHAWNAVRVEGRWYLMDVTWDAGSLNGSRFEKRYGTSNFLTPPEVFGLSHFPDREEWQLRERPLTRGEFFRQPMMRAEFYAHGSSLLSPRRSQVDVQRTLEVLVDNPGARFYLGKYRPREGAGHEGECTVSNGRQAKIVCDFPSPGRWEVTLFDGPQRYGSYVSVGSVDVNSR